MLKYFKYDPDVSEEYDLLCDFDEIDTQVRFDLERNQNGNPVGGAIRGQAPFNKKDVAAYFKAADRALDEQLKNFEQARADGFTVETDGPNFQVILMDSLIANNKSIRKLLKEWADKTLEIMK